MYFLFLPSDIKTQNSLPKNDIEINGTLLDVKSAPIAYATIALITLDSAIVKGEISGEKGDFKIFGIAPGNYRLMVQHMEYNTYYTNVLEVNSSKKNITFPDITLSPTVLKLDEVVVNARKVMIEIQADKIVFNVASSPSASGTNGLELLRKSPGVIVDMENNLSLLGKGGVQIFINGVASRLAGNDLATMLQSITSDNVESIEIISNPSSKYEAEGNAGIINIKLKKNISFGFNGNVT
ncbi:MAG TPA: carboxypeptidase regulatory-like domain-containing protein, partial [Saprospiraceae bacterium]|nr:carboxypeptidase regulatory-like domain-containing protein [Saprospiraceae bacterium]